MPIPLSKTSSEVPDWLLKTILPNLKSREEVSAAVKVPKSGDLTNVKTKIEESSKTGNDVCVNANLTSDQKKELEEYAQVCKVDPKKIVQVSEKDVLVSTKKAEVVKPVPDKDPFGTLDSFADPKNFEKNKDWNKVKKSQKVNAQGRSEPSATKEGTVTRVDGVEKYEGQRVVGVRPGENSIAAPDNIGETAKSTEKSSAQTIRDANKERKDKISFDKKKWEDNVKEKNSGIISKGGIKLTEASPQQSHTKVADGQHSIFDKKDPTSSVPEKTAGETLKEKNEQRKASIQRPKTDDKSWDKVQSSKKPVISDLFFEELKKRLPSQEKK